MSKQLDAPPTAVSVSGGTRARKRLPTLSEADLLQQISIKLDRVIAVLAAQGKDKEKQIDILAAAGCDSGFIGIVVGMTASSVRKFQSRQRGKTVQVPGNEAAVETD
jgi:hypothetical protein